MTREDCTQLMINATSENEKTTLERMQSEGCPDNLIDRAAFFWNIPTERNMWKEVFFEVQHDTNKCRKLLKLMQKYQAPIDIYEKVLSRLTGPDLVDGRDE